MVLIPFIPQLRPHLRRRERHLQYAIRGLEIARAPIHRHGAKCLESFRPWP